jgi:hypothetical protein
MLIAAVIAHRATGNGQSANNSSCHCVIVYILHAGYVWQDNHQSAHQNCSNDRSHTFIIRHHHSSASFIIIIIHHHHSSSSFISIIHQHHHSSASFIIILHYYHSSFIIHHSFIHRAACQLPGSNLPSMSTVRSFWPLQSSSQSTHCSGLFTFLDHEGSVAHAAMIRSNNNTTQQALLLPSSSQSTHCSGLFALLDYDESVANAVMIRSTA